LDDRPGRFVSADVLLEKGYEVHGMTRRSATGNTRNIEHLIDDPISSTSAFFVHKGDLADMGSLYRIIDEVDPDEIYNEADQDHVSWSFATRDIRMISREPLSEGSLRS